MIRFSKLAAALVVLPILAVTGSVGADSPGQLGGGANVFLVKNLTQKGSYASTVSTACGDEVQYSARLHNVAFEGLTNVMVSVNLNTGKMTATPAEGASQGTTATVTVTLPTNGSLAFESGSTVLYDSNGNVIKTLSDGITTVGVNIGNIGGSTTEFVNLKAKVACPPVTPVVSFACTSLDVVQIDRTRYDFTAHASVQNANVQSYGFTAKDSNGSTVDTNTVSTNALSAVYHFNQSAAGTYTVSAVVNTDHGSTSASTCSKQITVAAAPQVLSTTTPTKTLPNTGAGDVLGLFAGASGLGAAGHFVSRRFRR